MDEPAVFRIRVQGAVPEKWSGRLGGMKITVDRSDEKKPVTTLEGRLRDQASLAGVLNALYEQHLAVISVETVEKEGDGNSTAKGGSHE